MYSILDKNDSDSKNRDDIEPLYGPAILKKNRRFRDAVSWGCILLILLSFVAGLVVVSILLFNHGKSPELQSTDSHASQLPSQNSAPTVKPNGAVTVKVKTNCGYVKGVEDDGVFTFKGLPYAVPPVGKYRWKAPVSRATTTADCDVDAEMSAKTFGPKCLQWDSIGGSMKGSEDCLYLNVWTPTTDSAADMEVMVFIHGGGIQTDIGQLYGAGLLTGSGHEPGMMPTAELVKSANMVIVSFNYRLGPFGFLAVDVKDPETDQPIKGNFGLMDQHMAMEWVKNNSRAFGGNPEKMTVFGVGAGASSILIHLASSNKPLFQRAWTASPSPHFNTTLRTAYRQNQQFMYDSECRTAAPDDLHSCLHGLSPEAVFAAYPHDKWENKQFRDLPKENEMDNIRGLIIVDGEFLPRVPYNLWSAFGDHRTIPLLMGTTAQETDDWPLPSGIHEWTWVDYEQYLLEHLSAFTGDLAAKVQNLYKKEGTPELQFTTLVSDMRETCPVSAVAQLLNYYWHEPVYRYIANFTGNSPRGSPAESPHTDSDVITQSGDTIVSGFRYSYHSIDMQHFFNMCSDSIEAQQFTTLLRRSVFEFARTGEINGWNLYPNSTIISSHLTSVSTYQEEQCELWRVNGLFPKYAWMN